MINYMSNLRRERGLERGKTKEKNELLDFLGHMWKWLVLGEEIKK